MIGRVDLLAGSAVRIHPADLSGRTLIGWGDRQMRVAPTCPQPVAGAIPSVLVLWSHGAVDLTHGAHLRPEARGRTLTVGAARCRTPRSRTEWGLFALP